MKSLIFMQGIPGSGKSTVARSLIGLNEDAIVFSTDDFWYDVNGIYQFDQSRICEAHQWNQQRTIEAMQQEISKIIIDNTNIKRWNIESYLTVASIYGYEVSVIRIEVPLSVAIERQLSRPADRRIPASVIEAMHQGMERLL